MRSFGHDILFALRSFGRAPRSPLAAFSILAAGIGLSVTVFSLAEAGLRQDQPIVNPPELLGVEATGGIQGWTARMITPVEIQTENLHALLGILLVLTCFVLAIVCVNAVVVVLARGTARQREMAVRATVGARPARLGLQLLAEATVLLLAAGAAGLGLAVGGIGVLRRTWPEGLPLWLEGPGAASVAAGVGIPLAAVLLAILAPGLVGLRRNLSSALTTGTRATATPGEGFLRRVLVAVAIAATVVLLVSAALLFEATVPRQAGPADAEAAPALALEDGVLIHVELGPEHAPAARTELYESLLSALEEAVGTGSASAATAGTMMGLGIMDHDVVNCGRCSRGGLYLPVFASFARHHVVGPGYFDTLGITIESGREFRAADRPGAPLVAVVNQAYRESFERGDPLGRTVRVGGISGGWYTVVGVVSDPAVRGIGGGSGGEPAVYLSALQNPPEAVILIARPGEGHALDPEALATRLASVEHGVNERAPSISRVSTAEEVFDRFLAPLRWLTRVFGILALLALILATAALYGTISGLVRERRREIGIHMALGASPGRITRRIVTDGIRTTAIGTALGLWGAAGVAAVLQERFDGVAVFDAKIFTGAAVLLLLIGGMASWRPAREAAAIPPDAAIRPG